MCCVAPVLPPVPSPLLVHHEFSMEVLVVSGALNWVQQFLGFDQLLTVPLQIVRLSHHTPAPRQTWVHTAI